MFAILIAALLLDPAATLRPDSFDAPAPASVANAAQASAPQHHHHHMPPPPKPVKKEKQ